jgi:MAF protein
MVVVIGSDTAVADAGEILGKPKDASDAERMLRQLRGRTHQVYTGVALYEPQSDTLLREVSVSDVPMRAYSDAEIAAYIRSGDPLDKAGAYAIQHPDFQPVESFSGCYASVMGLPLCHVARMLKKTGLDVDAELPQKCQGSLAYECTVFADILREENFG